MKNFKNGFLIIALVLILVSTVFMSIQGHAGEVELDFSYTEMQHSWRGPDNVGDFEGAMKSYGATYWKDNGFGLRLGYGTSERLESTGGRFNRLVVDIDPIISVELLYRFNISDEVYLFGGVGQYYIPSSAYSLDTDYVDKDRDDDNGFMFGVGWRLNKHVSIAYRFTQYSRITVKPYDEWTRGHGIHLIFRF